MGPRPDTCKGVRGASLYLPSVGSLVRVAERVLHVSDARYGSIDAEVSVAKDVCVARPL